jgi:hypothetical protein
MAADMLIFRRLADNGFSFREVDGYCATPIFHALEYGTSDFFPSSSITMSRYFRH